MARGGVIGGIVVLAAAAAAVWFFVGSSSTAPVVDGDGADEAAAVVADPALAGGGKRPAAVSGAPESAFVGTIRGRVIRPDGTAVAGVRVLARPRGGGWDGRPSVEASQRGKRETDQLQRTLASLDDPKPGENEVPPAATGESGPDGRFVLKVDAVGTYSIEASPAPPLSRGMAYWNFVRERPDGSVIVTVVEGGALRGTVVDGTDRPLAAVVGGTWSVGDRSGAVNSVATDPTTGAFTLEAVPAGRALLTVRVAGRGEWSVKTPVPAPEPFVIRVPSGGTVVGRVTDGAGAPVADVELLVTSGPREPPPAGPMSSRVRGKSAADGSFRLVGMLPGRVSTVAMLAPGRPARTESAGRARWTGAEVRDGAETRLDLVFARGGVVTGRVTEVGTKAPVADAEVLLFVRQMGGMSNYEAVRVKTDATGLYRFEDVPFGRYATMPMSPKHYFAPAVGRGSQMMWDGSGQGVDAPWVVVSAEAEVVERDLELTPGLTLVGSVRGPDGAPVAGAEVRAANASPLYQGAWSWGVNMTLGNQPLATSDAEGAFRIANLPPSSDLTLYAAKPPLLGGATERLKLEVGAPPPPPLVLTLAAGATVVGRVVDAEGKGLAAWMVNFHSQDPKAPGWGNTTTDEEGRFRLEGVPATKLQIAAQSTSGRSGASAQLQLDPALAPGEVREGVELKVAKMSYLRGVVVDEAGKPAANVALFVQGQASFPVSTDEDGKFDIAVPAGAYEIGVRQASGWGMDGPSTSATAPAEGLRVTAKPTEKTFTVIGGRVVAADGTRIPTCTVSIKADGSPNATNDEIVGGEFRREMTGKPPFTVTASVARGSRGELLNLKSNKVVVEKDTLDVVLTLEKGLVIKGRVLTPAGEPAPGITLRAGAISAVSDATGEFVLPGFSSGDPVALTAQPPSTFIAPPNVTARPGGEEVVVRLLPSGSVSGRVVGLEDAKGLQAWVYVTNGGRAATVGPDGTFKVEGLPASGTVDLSMNTWDSAGNVSPFVVTTLKGVPIGSEGVVLTVSRGVHIRGVVVDADGAPVANTFIQASGDGSDGTGGQSDGNGAFVLGAVRPGAYTLTVHRQNGGIAVKDVKVDAPADGVRIVVPRSRKISGRVLGANGKPVNLAVFADGANGPEQTGWGPCGSDGRFSIDVTGDGPFRVNAMFDDRYGRAERVMPGTDVEIPLVVGLEITGVVEAEARGASGTYVMAAGDGWTGGAPCDAEGAFRVRGLPAGRYTLRIYKQDASSMAVPTEGTPVDAGATNVRLR